jgi:hypothetical protein
VAAWLSDTFQDICQENNSTVVIFEDRCLSVCFLVQNQTCWEALSDHTLAFGSDCGLDPSRAHSRNSKIAVESHTRVTRGGFYLINGFSLGLLPGSRSQRCCAWPRGPRGPWRCALWAAWGSAPRGNLGTQLRRMPLAGCLHLSSLSSAAFY